MEEKTKRPEDEALMREAIRLAESAVRHGNEPFGAVLARDGEIVFSNENQIYTKKDPTEHAELGLVRRFAEQTGITDLRDYTLYSSCEPCFMCSGSLVWMHLGRLVYGASNEDLEQILGEKGSPCAALVFAGSSWAPRVLGGVLRKEAAAVLADYFASHEKG